MIAKITLEIDGQSIHRNYEVQDGDFTDYGEVIADMANTLMVKFEDLSEEEFEWQDLRMKPTKIKGMVDSEAHENERDNNLSFNS